MRAHSTAMPIRPNGVTNATNATTISHQFTDTVHGTRCKSWAMLLPTASQVTHGNAANVVSGIAAAVWISWVSRGVGPTTRSSTCGGGPSSSRNPASDPSRGWSYRSATVTCGYWWRSMATSCAAASEPPPSAKKSASGPEMAAPSRSRHIPASQPVVPARSGVSSVSLLPGGGQGSASRSTLPDVRVGSSSICTRRGTSAAGRCSAS